MYLSVVEAKNWLASTTLHSYQEGVNDAEGKLIFEHGTFDLRKTNMLPFFRMLFNLEIIMIDPRFKHCTYMAIQKRAHFRASDPGLSRYFGINLTRSMLTPNTWLTK